MKERSHTEYQTEVEVKNKEIYELEMSNRKLG